MKPNSSTTNAPDSETGASPAALFAPVRLARLAVAGGLMGIANLIPGVSGGTMILAMGVYQEFIDSVADVTRFKFSLRRVVFLGVVGVFAASAILGLAGAILYLLFHYTTAMFALFIGLTLGGAPILFGRLRPIRADVVISVIIGLGLMIGVFFFKSGGSMPQNTAMDFTSGIVGSTTMILPGVSGSYMLLVLGQYERVIGSLDDLKGALQTKDMGLLRAALWIVVPVGIGAVLGVILLSNLLKYLLHRHARVTVGVLLGVLLGSVAGLWPFGKPPGEKALERRGLSELVEFGEAWEIPGVADSVARYDLEKLEIVDRNKLADHLRETIESGWSQRGQSSYSGTMIGQAAVAVVVGFLLTFALARRKAVS